ncbi:PLP-dependent transferase [Sphingobacterium griseoflavum]|uniref:PLP-dependent transferase n=1 Tax=Sphingobacterium griseoflavum TaxID=1474952 RepID=UPI0016789E9C|nr:PLP-dependent transferase [Sphingobacterium griseoflavum]
MNNFQTSTYLADADLSACIEAATATKHPEFYHRHGNPTNSQVAEIVAKMENTEDALVLATCMAAIIPLLKSKPPASPAACCEISGHRGYR